MKRCIVILVAGVLLLAGPASSTIINVPGDQPTIQAGIDASLDGDTVLVGQGTYIENIDFGGKMIVVKSTAGAESTSIEAFDPDLPVVSMISNEPKGVQVCGFTITGSNHGGIFCDGSAPAILYNIVTGNSSSRNNDAAGIDLNNTVGSLIKGNIIMNNIANTYGPAIHTEYSSQYDTIAHNMMYDNNGIGDIRCLGDITDLQVYNNTISVTSYSGLTNQANGIIFARNNIIFNAPNFGIQQAGGLIFAEYNCTFNNAIDYNFEPGEGNIFEDARFADAENANFSLQPYSPCIDAGDPDPFYNDPDGTRNDMGAYYYNQSPRIWHVSVDGNDVNGDGSVGNPFATFQHAIDMAIDGDTVLVWPGTYTGEGNRAISPDGKSIVIKSLLGAESTIIDVEGQPYGFFSECYNPPEDLNIVIDGFTITNADYGIHLNTSGVPHLLQNLHIESCLTGIDNYSNPTTIEGCRFSNNDKGIDSNRNQLQVRNSTFVGNGIGVYTYCLNHDVNSDQCLFDSCTFEANSTAISAYCTVSNSTIRGGEYGIHVPWPMDIIVENCLFEDISTTVFNAGGSRTEIEAPDSLLYRLAMDYYGPGVAVFNSIIRNNNGNIGSMWSIDSDYKTLVFDNCQIYGNSGGVIGSGRLTMIESIYENNSAGIDIVMWAPCEISGSKFLNNDSDAIRLSGNVSGNININKTIFCQNSGYGLHLGGYSWRGEDIYIEGCTFAYNNSGGIVIPYSESDDSLSIDNCIIVNNNGLGLELEDYIGWFSIVYSNVFNNTAGNYGGIEDQTGLNGNISEDPLFIDPDNGNYHLQCASPCVDTGDPELFDPDSTRSDMGAFYLPHYYSPTETGIIAPPNGSVADSLTWLTWLESTDEDTSCNTVFYRLQIDEDPNFESPEVNVDTLPASGFLLEETISYRILSLPGWLNLLADSTYFWRVGSVDEIGDTSAWTPGPNYFIFVVPAQIPTLSEWGMVILGLLLLAAGTIAIIRRRKEAFANEH